VLFVSHPRRSIAFSSGKDFLRLQQWKTNPKHEPYTRGDNAATVQVGTAEAWLTTIKKDGQTTYSVRWDKDGMS
jgi:hypothetical protein